MQANRPSSDEASHGAVSLWTVLCGPYMQTSPNSLATLLVGTSHLQVLLDNVVVLADRQGAMYVR